MRGFLGGAGIGLAAAVGILFAVGLVAPKVDPAKNSTAPKDAQSAVDAAQGSDLTAEAGGSVRVATVDGVETAELPRTEGDTGADEDSAQLGAQSDTQSDAPRDAAMDAAAQSASKPATGGATPIQTPTDETAAPVLTGDLAETNVDTAPEAPDEPEQSAQEQGPEAAEPLVVATAPTTETPTQPSAGVPAEDATPVATPKPETAPSTARPDTPDAAQSAAPPQVEDTAPSPQDRATDDTATGAEEGETHQEDTPRPQSSAEAGELSPKDTKDAEVPTPMVDAPNAPRPLGKPATQQLGQPVTQPLGEPVTSFVDREDDARIGGLVTVPPKADTDGGTPMPPAVPNALRDNAVGFENTAGKALMSFVLMEPNQPEQRDQLGQALAGLEMPLAVAVDPLSPGAASRSARYRSLGVEVVLLADLPFGATAQDAEVAMNSYFEAVPDAVAVMDSPSDGSDDAPAPSRAGTTQMVTILAASGHGLLSQPRGLNTALQIARRENVPADVFFRHLTGARSDVIRRNIDRSALRAGQVGTVILLAQANEVLLASLATWGLENLAGPVVIAPVSASLLAQ